MWSDTRDVNDDKILFAVHQDGDPVGTWSTTETAIDGRKMADDHINLKADSKGRIFAVTKTKFSGATKPGTMLLRRTTAGKWKHFTVSRGSLDHTRPIVLLDQRHNRIRVFEGSTHNNAVFMKSQSSQPPVVSRPQGRSSRDQGQRQQDGEPDLDEAVCQQGALRRPRDEPGDEALLACLGAYPALTMGTDPSAASDLDDALDEAHGREGRSAALPAGRGLGTGVLWRRRGQSAISGSVCSSGDGGWSSCSPRSEGRSWRTRSARASRPPTRQAPRFLSVIRRGFPPPTPSS